jgi:hypothetical protein
MTTRAAGGRPFGVPINRCNRQPGNAASGSTAIENLVEKFDEREWQPRIIRDALSLLPLAPASYSASEIQAS